VKLQGRRGLRWEGNTKMDVQGIGREGVDWIYLGAGGRMLCT